MKRGFKFKKIALTLLAAALPCFGWAATTTYEWNSNTKRFELDENAFTFPAGFEGAFTLSATFKMPDVSTVTGDIIVFKATNASDGTSTGEIGLKNWNTGTGSTILQYSAGTEDAVKSGGHYSNTRLHNGGNGANTLTVSVADFASGIAGTATFGFTFANGQTKDAENALTNRTFNAEAFAFTDVSLVNGATLESATLTVTALVEYTREINGASQWSDTEAWTNTLDSTKADVPAENESAKLTLNANSTITMNASATLGKLTVTGSGTATFAATDTNSLTSGKTVVETNTDVSDVTGTASLGAVTIAEGKTLNLASPGTTLTTLAGGDSTSAVNWNVAAGLTPDTTLRTSICTFPGVITFTGSGENGVQMKTTTRNEGRALASRLVFDGGKHSFSYGMDGSALFATGGGDTDPTITVTGGATLEFGLADLSGWNGAIQATPAVFLVGENATLDLTQVNGGSGFFRNRILLENGATIDVSATNENKFFSLYGGLPADATAQIALKAGTESAPKTAKITGNLVQYIGSTPLEGGTADTRGSGIFVGEYATLTMESKVAGNGAFKKLGAGTLVYATENTHSGTTDISAGTLRLSGDGTLGTSAVSGAGTLEINVAQDAEKTVSNAISVAGTIKKTGEGTATISSAMSGSGAITVEAGTLKLTNTNTRTGNVTIAEGATLDVSGEGATLFSVSTGSSPNVMIQGTLKARAWDWAETADTSSFGKCRNNTSFTVDGGEVIFTEQNVTTIRGFTIGAGGATFRVESGKSLTFSKIENTISGTGAFTKEGAGVLTLARALPAISAMNVNAGTLTVSADQTYTGLTTVATGVTIGGTGSLTGGLTLAAGAILDATAETKLTVGGALTLNGEITVKVTTLPETNGKSVTILNGTLPAGTHTAILTTGAGDRCVAALSENEGAIIAKRTGSFISSPEISVGEGCDSFSKYLGSNRLDVENLGALTITFTANGQTFTFDNEAALAFASIKVSAENGVDTSTCKIVSGSGAGTITAATTAINTTVDVSGAELALGEVTIAAEKTLTIDDDMTNVLTSVTDDGDGTLKFIGGTAEDPLAVAGMAGKKVAIGEGHVQPTEVNNKVHIVTGDNPGVSYYYFNPSGDFGLLAGTSIRNVTLVHQNRKFWWERGDFTGSILNVGAELHLNTTDNAEFHPTIAGLEGSANVTQFSADNGTHTLTIATSSANRATEYAGRITAGNVQVIVSGDGTQTFSGTNIYTLGTTISETATLKLTGSGTLGSGAVTIAEGAKLVATADVNTALPNAFAGSGTITVESGTLDLSGATIANTLKLVVSDGATVIVAKEQLEAFATITTAETATIKFSPDMSLLLCGGTISATLTDGDHAIAGSIQVGTVTAEYEYADGKLTMTVPGDSTMTGSNWWWDYEFNGNVESIGYDTGSMTLEGDATSYTDAIDGNQELYFQKTPYRGATFATEDAFSAVMYCQPGACNNSALVGFGSTTAEGQVAVALATGANAKNGEMQILLIKGSEHAVTSLADHLIVPNATTAKHLYAFTFEALADKTVISVYVDGKRKKTTTVNERFHVSNGFQIGSLHGGVHKNQTALEKYDASGDSGTIDFLRVTKGILSMSAMQALAAAYPYVSENGTAVRTITDDATTTWVANDAWTQSQPNQEDAQQTAPNPGTNVTLTAGTETEAVVTVNLDADVTYESLLLNGTSALKIVKGNSKINAGDVTIATDTTIEYGAVEVGTLLVNDGKTLTFDFTAYDFASIFEPRMIPLTGLATLGTDAAVTVRLPETLPGQIAAAKCVFNENTQEYVLSVTIKDGTLTAVVPTAGTTWDSLVWKIGEATIDSSVIDFTSLPLVLQAETDGATLTLGSGLTLANLTIEGAKLNLAGAHTLAIPVAGLTTTTALSLAAETTLDLTSGDAVAGLTKLIEGTGTVKVKLTPNHGNVVELSGFDGTTHVTAGYLSVDVGSLGATLKLADGTQVQTTTVTTDATLNLVLDGTVQFHANTNKHYTTTGTIRGTKLDKQGGGTLTAAGITSQLALSVGPVVINPGAGIATTLGQLSGGNALTIASGTVTVESANGDYTGNITVESGATLTSTGSNAIPFTKGAIVNNGEVSISNGNLPPVSGTGNITVAGDATLAGAITTTGTVTVNSGVTATMATKSDYSSSTPGINAASLAVNGTLTVTNGTITIAAGKVLSGIGTINGTVTFADTAVVDASAGALTVGTVNWPAGGITVTKGAVGPFLTYTGSAPEGVTFVVAGDLKDARVGVKTETADEVVTTTLSVVQIVMPEASDDVTEAEAAAATQIVANYLTASGNTGKKVTAITNPESTSVITGAAGVTLTDTGDETCTATLTYTFGVSGLTALSATTETENDITTYTLVAKVQLGDELEFADGVTVGLVDANGNAITTATEVGAMDGTGAALTGKTRYFKYTITAGKSTSSDTFGVKAHAKKNAQ